MCEFYAYHHHHYHHFHHTDEEIHTIFPNHCKIQTRPCLWKCFISSFIEYTWDSDSFYQEQAPFSIVHTLICIKSLKTSHLMKQDGIRMMGIYGSSAYYSLCFCTCLKLSIIKFFLSFYNQLIHYFFYSPSQGVECFHGTMIFLVFHFDNPRLMDRFLSRHSCQSLSRSFLKGCPRSAPKTDQQFRGLLWEVGNWLPADRDIHPWATYLFLFARKTDPFLQLVPPSESPAAMLSSQSQCGLGQCLVWALKHLIPFPILILHIEFEVGNHLSLQFLSFLIHWWRDQSHADSYSSSTLPPSPSFFKSF